mgnify:FL=1
MGIDLHIKELETTRLSRVPLKKGDISTSRHCEIDEFEVKGSRSLEHEGKLEVSEQFIRL